MKHPKRTFPVLSDRDLAELNDFFPPDGFHSDCWSARPVDSVPAIRALLDSFRLVGRKIRHVWTTSHDYRHATYPLEDAVHADLQERVGLSEADAQAGSSARSFDRRAQLARCMEIDESFVLEFDSRETFEIFVTDAPVYRLSMNRIPRRLLENGFDNVNPQVMFAPVIGRTISGVDLRTVPDGGGATVDAVLLRLDDETTLEILGFFDFLGIYLLDRARNPCLAPIEALLPAFFNHDDLHFNRRTGFDAKDGTLWFGRKARFKLGSRAMSLTLPGPDGKPRDRALVDFRDALGIVLGICATRPGAFAASGPVEWTAAEWRAVLDAGRQLLASPRLADAAAPAARLFLDTPPAAGAVTWCVSAEERMRLKRNLLLACLDEISRWLATALPPAGRIRLEW